MGHQHGADAAQKAGAASGPRLPTLQAGFFMPQGWHPNISGKACAYAMFTRGWKWAATLATRTRTETAGTARCLLLAELFMCGAFQRFAEPGTVDTDDLLMIAGFEIDLRLLAQTIIDDCRHTVSHAKRWHRSELAVFE